MSTVLLVRHGLTHMTGPVLAGGSRRTHGPDTRVTAVDGTIRAL